MTPGLTSYETRTSKPLIHLYQCGSWEIQTLAGLAQILSVDGARQWPDSRGRVVGGVRGDCAGQGAFVGERQNILWKSHGGRGDAAAAHERKRHLVHKLRLLRVDEHD